MTLYLKMYINSPRQLKSNTLRTRSQWSYIIIIQILYHKLLLIKKDIIVAGRVQCTGIVHKKLPLVCMFEINKDMLFNPIRWRILWFFHQLNFKVEIAK